MRYINIIYISLFFVISFFVLLSSTGKPNQPINVICEGRINSATVYWKSGFNGGEKQAFTVYYKRNENDGNSKWTAFGTKYSDPGQNMNISAEIQPLEAGTSFVFQINASNAYSYTVSESSYCNTSEAGTHSTPQTAFNCMIYI